MGMNTISGTRTMNSAPRGYPHRPRLTYSAAVLRVVRGEDWSILGIFWKHRGDFRKTQDDDKVVPPEPPQRSSSEGLSEKYKNIVSVFICSYTNQIMASQFIPWNYSFSSDF